VSGGWGRVDKETVYKQDGRVDMPRPYAVIHVKPVSAKFNTLRKYYAPFFRWVHPVFINLKEATRPIRTYN